MLKRVCAGGVVFSGDRVLLLKNEKGEWVLPKGVIRNGGLSREVALRRVKEEAGVDAEIISAVGETSYEFFSVTRQRPVCNEITWYLMTALNTDYKISESDGFLDGGFFPIDDAINRITYSQDKALVSLSYKKYKQMAV